MLVKPADKKEREPVPATAPVAAGGGLMAALPPFGLARIKRMYAGEAVVPAELKGAPLAFRNRYITWSPVRQLEAERTNWPRCLKVTPRCVRRLSRRTCR